MDFQREGYCGLYCGACPVLLATEKRERVDPLQNAQLPAEQVCFGCKSEKSTPWCTDCALKHCARSKGFDSCAQCDEVPCEPMTRFVEDPQWPYHKAVPKNWRLIREQGMAEWSRDQAVRWQCPSCGAPFAWRDETCAQCGNPVSNYTADL